MEGRHKAAKQGGHDGADDAAQTKAQIDDAVVLGQVVETEEVAHQRGVDGDGAAEAEGHTGHRHEEQVGIERHEQQQRHARQGNQLGNGDDPDAGHLVREDTQHQTATQVGHGDDGDGIGGDYGRQTHHLLADILGYADDVEAAHAGGQEHQRQHPVLRLAHRLGQGEVTALALLYGSGLLGSILHQHAAHQHHGHGDQPPQLEGGLKAGAGEQQQIDVFETETAETIGTDGAGGDQPLALREPLHAVGEGHQVAGTVGKTDQNAGAEVEHRQIAGMGSEEEADAEQHASTQRHVTHPEPLLQLARHGGGDCQREAEQAESESDLTHRLVQLVGELGVEQAPGVDGTQCELGDNGTDQCQVPGAVQIDGHDASRSMALRKLRPL